MDDIVLVQVVDRAQDLFDGLGRVLLGELALLANAVEQLSAGRELGDDVVLVLNKSRISFDAPVAFPRGKVGGILLIRTSPQT